MGIQFDGINNKISSGSKIDFPGSVGVAGTLTYEDVANVDSVGIVTARTGIKIGPTAGVAGTFFADGSYVTAGVVTATTFYGSGANLTNLNASNIASGTVPTARLGSGTANSSTFLAGDSTYKTVTGTTINNNANNRIITGSGTANTLEGESTLTYDGTNLDLSDDKKIRIGTGQDLNIYHQSSDNNSYVKVDNGTLVIHQSGASNGILVKNQGGTELWMLKGGGNIEPGFNNFFSIGDTGKQVNNIYTKNLYVGDDIIHNGDTNTKIRFPAADQISFETDGSERLKIYSTGATASTATNNGQITHIFRNNDTTSGSSAMTVEHHFNFNRTGGGMDSSAGRIIAGKEREWVGGASNQDGYLAFHTLLNETSTERMRIKSNGVVDINGMFCAGKPGNFGSVSSTQGCRITGQQGSHPAALSFDGGGAPTLELGSTSGQTIIGSNSYQSSPMNFKSGMAIGTLGGGTTRFQINSNGNIGAPTGNNIYNASDERLKENMVELTDGLSKIQKLKPISFTWKEGWDVNLDGKKEYGFGAQTTEAVDEMLVEPFSLDDAELNGETIEKPLRVNEKYIIPLLVKAIQELSAEVAALKDK